jgi:hypothetical protein
MISELLVDGVKIEPRKATIGGLSHAVLNLSHDILICLSLNPRFRNSDLGLNEIFAFNQSETYEFLFVVKSCLDENAGSHLGIYDMKEASRPADTDAKL